jgi:hypothetical protein
MNLFAQKYTGQRMDFTGNAGFKFTPAEALSVTACTGKPSRHLKCQGSIANTQKSEP